jgi:cobyrinic acid a,c-diamide synthase
VTPGLLIAAPASGSGKTLVTLALLRRYRNEGRAVASVKVGPDYIDGAFHSAAGGQTCLNLDTWAMRPETLAALFRRAGEGADLLLGEGVMGLFDGAPPVEGTPGSGPAPGSTAALAAATGWPVVLVVDAKGMAASAAALVQGYAGFDRRVTVAGVVFNRVGGASHAEVLREACAPLGIPLLGALPRREDLQLPERHLGLVQAIEHPDLEGLLERAAAWAGEHLDLAALAALARPAAPGSEDGEAQPLPPLGQRIAVARDEAFAFSYPFVLDGWRAAGAEVSVFSPLADAAPDADADAVYLPGGYPELHAGRLAGNRAFLEGLRAAASRGAAVYGECGGYMVLGQGLEDPQGDRHAMAGLLPVVTSFRRPRLSLGYRQAELAAAGPLGAAGAAFRGHEFHFARLLGEPSGAPLFRCRDARGRDLGGVGGREGSVSGSFMHLVDRAPAG